MATTTNKLGLTKPDLADSADIRVINNNMDVLDTYCYDTRTMANANIIKPTVSGTSINLTDSADAPVQNMEVHGKNLLNKDMLVSSVSSNGVTYTKQSDGSYIRVGTSTANSSPRLYHNKTKPILIIKKGMTVFTTVRLRDDSDELIARDNTVFTALDDTSIYGIEPEGQRKEITYNDIIYPQIEIGTSFTSYEPYTKDIDVTVSNEDETFTQTTTIDTELQTGWENLKTYYPVTNIIPTPSATIECTYIADTKNYIDNKIAELTALTLEG